MFYQQRALPVAWIAVKGHLAEDMHIALLEQVAPLIADAAEVVFLGDGEFDGIRLQQTLDTTYGWHYVCRTAKSIVLSTDEGCFTSAQFDFRSTLFLLKAYVANRAAAARSVDRRLVRMLFFNSK